VCGSVYLEAVDGELCLVEVMEVSDVIRCVLRCMLESVEGWLCLLEELEMPKVMRCVRWRMSEVLKVMRRARGCQYSS